MYKSPIVMPVEGIDLLSPDTEIRPGRARRVINADIDRSGTLTRRAGRHRIAAGTDFHTIRATAAGLFVGRGTGLYLTHPETGQPLVLTDLGDPGPFDFADYNGWTYILTPTNGVFRVRADGHAQRCGVALPSQLPTAHPHPNGALPAGRYGVAITAVDSTGEESPAATLGQVHLPDGGGVRLAGFALDQDTQYNVYLTAPDSQVLRMSEAAYGGLGEYIVTRYPDGAVCNTRDLQPLPGGHIIRAARGRILIAQGDTLWYSEPLRPHLHDPSAGFVRFVGRIRMVEPIDAGVLVGDDHGVWLLDGADFSDVRLRQVSTTRMLAGTSKQIPAGVARRADAVGAMVVWLSTEGYVLADATGRAIALHADRVRISDTLVGQSALVFKDGATRLITMTGEGSAFGFGLANRSDNDA